MRKAFFSFMLRLFNLPKSDISVKKRGLIIILVDGLGYEVFKRNHTKNKYTFFSKIFNKDYRLIPYFTGLPATTTATEAELFFGESTNIPSFTWFDRKLFKFVRGNRGPDIALFEKTIRKRSELLKNGSCILGVYSAGATLCNLSGEAFNIKNPFASIKKLQYLFIFLNPYRFLYTCYLVFRSILLSSWMLLKKKSKNKFMTILRDSFSRIFLGNIMTYIAELEISRETPILFIDYVLYDEFAHEYGIESKTSHSSLRLIDFYCESLYHASKKAQRRYEFIILSDHGQTPSIPIHISTADTLETMFAAALSDKSRRIIRTYGGFSADSINMKKDIYLVPSGSTMHVYFSEKLQDGYYENELNTMYPYLTRNLLSQKEIGWILLKKDSEHQILIGKYGSVEFSRGKIKSSKGKPFGKMIPDDQMVQSFAKYATYGNNGDLVLFGALNHDGRLYAFEEHKGTHGGFYGEMTKPFIITNNETLIKIASYDTDMKKLFQHIRSLHQ
ncbi:MAG: alkaline phosphatase family protein [Patescibacteria group bacterium]